MTVRLPSDHWLWQEANRREVIEEALKQHRDFSPEIITEIRQMVEEIKSRLSGEEKIASQSQEEKAEINTTGEIDAKEFLKTIKNAFEF